MNLDDSYEVDELPAPPRRSIPEADRELLELAGRAIGAVRIEVVEGESWVNLQFADGSVAYAWNSLMHSDDMLNLSAQLLIGIDHSKFCVHARDDHGNDLATVDVVGGTRVEATRRAVTSAAAEIYKQRS